MVAASSSRCFGGMLSAIGGDLEAGAVVLRKNAGLWAFECEDWLASSVGLDGNRGGVVRPVVEGVAVVMVVEGGSESRVGGESAGNVKSGARSGKGRMGGGGECR